MTKPMVRIHDVENDTITDREMTDIEYEAYLDQAEALEAKEAEVTAHEETKAALLERLGITADEAKLLLA